MYIEIVPNRNSRPAILLRSAERQGKKILKQTLANLTHWPAAQVESLRRVLRGDRLLPTDELFKVERSLPHGHVEAVLSMVRKLGLDGLLAAKRCRERDLVIAMIVERVVHPCSKLATARHWNDTTLAQELSLGETDVDELYDALDWLLARQARLEAKLAGRHLPEGALVLYDVSTSYYYGQHCPLTQFGHDRDGKKGLEIIVYGVLTDRHGCPVSVQVYPGNTADPKTVPDQVDKLRKQFKLLRVVLVGDRGMLTQTQIDQLKQYPGLGWLSALRSSSIRELVEQGQLQPSLFDQQNLAEIQSPEFPGERLMACFNPLLAEQRRHKREALLSATEKSLKSIAAQVARRKHKRLTAQAVGQKVGRVINRYKMAKHFDWTFEADVFGWSRREESIRAEAQLDGIYVVRTSEAEAQLSSPDTVRGYKGLGQVERAFRCLKGVDVRIRPIFHRTEDHVRAHVFLCLLAYYVEWHLRAAWSELLFEDEELPQARQERDPVAPAEPSSSVKRKKAARQTKQGLPVHSFQTLLDHLATRSRHTCRLCNQPKSEPFEVLTEATALHQRAMKLIEMYPVPGNPNST